MRTWRIAVAFVAAAALVPLTAGSAFAAPPANDTPGGATVVTLGDTIKEDTTEATTGSLDAKVNQYCGAPFTNASVWFTYTPEESGGFIVDGSASDYPTGFMVFRGAPKGTALLACGPESVGVRAKAGTTYTIMAFDPNSSNGGNLVMSLEAAPPAPTIDVTVSSTGRAFPNGNALVKGTYTCTNADFVDQFGSLVQIWKRVKITAYFEKFYLSTCDGTPQPWQRVVSSDNGLFAAGEATVSTDALACGELECRAARLDDVAITLVGPGEPLGHGHMIHADVTPVSQRCSVQPKVPMYDARPAC